MTTTLLVERVGRMARAVCCLALIIGMCACTTTERRLMSQPFPEIVREPQMLRDIYRFAGSNLGLMSQLPCYCGCDDALGHMSAADCFVDKWRDARRATWSDHGAMCGMCLGIAQDAMTLHGKNMSPAEIRRHIETKYGASRNRAGILHQEREHGHEITHASASSGYCLARHRPQRRAGERHAPGAELLGPDR
jgi:hypothetical protein